MRKDISMNTLVAMTKQSNSPVVSVVIPVRNGKDFIHEALDSVLSQSFTDLEVIIVNDGSTDYDYALLEEIDPRVKVLDLSGCGVSTARNKGMQHARGTYIAFLDADDVWFPGKLEAQISYFNFHPEVGVVYGKFIKWHPDANGVFPAAESSWVNCANLTRAEANRSGWIYTKLLMGLLVGMNTAVIRRSVYYQIGGFNEAMRIGEDYDFWLRAARVAEMHSLDGDVAFYRIHNASAMHKLSRDNHMANLLKSADVRWGLTNPDQTSVSRQEFDARLAKVHFGHGYLHFWHGQLEVAQKAFLEAFLGGALRFKSTVYLVATLFRALLSKVSN
jgi:glycosyltransferase involved in cell wall biosynthesis